MKLSQIEVQRNELARNEGVLILTNTFQGWFLSEEEPFGLSVSKESARFPTPGQYYTSE